MMNIRKVHGQRNFQKKVMYINDKKKKKNGNITKKIKLINK